IGGGETLGAGGSTDAAGTPARGRYATAPIAAASAAIPAAAIVFFLSTTKAAIACQMRGGGRGGRGGGVACLPTRRAMASHTCTKAASCRSPFQPERSLLWMSLKASGGRVLPIVTGTKQFLSSPSWASDRTQRDSIDKGDQTTRTHFADLIWASITASQVSDT